jgi:hypothetical protein
VASMALGAAVGWALSLYLWNAGFLHPWYNYIVTFLAMTGPIILPTIVGLRNKREALYPLVGFPLLATFGLWMLAPGPSLTPNGLGQYVVNELYPRIIVPTLILGSVVGMAYAKWFQCHREKAPEEQPLSQDFLRE